MMMTTKRISFVLLATALMFIFIAGQNNQSSVKASGDSAPQLEGSWVDNVTGVSGFGAGSTHKNLSTYSRGGGLVTLPAPVPPPLQSSAGHGTWIHKGGRDFAYTCLFFLYDPSGQHVFTVKLHEDITLGEGGNEYDGISSFDVFDPAGNLVPGFSGGGTTHCTRITD